jgi:hypothetical protein
MVTVFCFLWEAHAGLRYIKTHREGAEGERKITEICVNRERMSPPYTIQAQANLGIFFQSINFLLQSPERGRHAVHVAVS